MAYFTAYNELIQLGYVTIKHCCNNRYWYAFNQNDMHYSAYRDVSMECDD